MIHLSSTYWCQDSLSSNNISTSLPDLSSLVKKNKKKLIYDPQGKIPFPQKTPANLASFDQDSSLNFQKDNNQLSLFDTLYEQLFLSEPILFPTE